MSRSKLGLLGLCAVTLGLMAFMVNSAQAAEWLILNSKGEVKTAKELPAGITSELEHLLDGTLLTKLVGISTRILCDDFFLEGTKLEGEGKLTTGSRAFLAGCEVPSTFGCTVKSPGSSSTTIESNKLKGRLQTNGEMLIEPEAGTALAELVFEGAECVLPTGAVEPINGVLWIKDCEGKVETHLEKHLIEESKSHYTKDKKGVVRLGTLYIGKDSEEHLETSIDGSAWVLLFGGTHSFLSWGATLP